MWKLTTHWSADGPHTLHGQHYPQNPRVALFHQNSIYLIRDHLIYRLNEFNYDKELEIMNIDKILKPPPTKSIRSGFTYARRHYIFTKNHAYVYDSTNGNLLHGYPKPINGWFACETESQPPKWNKKITTTTTTTTTTVHHRNHERHNHHHHHHPPPHKHHGRHHTHHRED